MLTFTPGALGRAGATLLVVGAHADDIEIGAGGTILSLLDAHPAAVEVTWLVLSASAARAQEARASAAAFSAQARSLDVRVLDLPDGRFPGRWEAVKAALEELARDVSPDLLLCPRRGDAHQDHDLLARVVPTCFRDHAVWGYEIPKYDGDTTQPHLYVPLEPSVLERKITLLHEHFASQRGRDWWDEELFRALPRLRGVECRSRYAEAFVAAKTVVSW